MLTKSENQTTVDRWNAQVPVGTPVRYWTGTREDPAKTGVTRSTAQLLGGHTPVVWVTGHGACIALTHVDLWTPAPNPNPTHTKGGGPR